MAVSRDILQTYRKPRQVMARLLTMGQREDRLLAILMAGCALMFVSRMPSIAREAHLTGQEQNMLMGGALLGIIFIAPLGLYSLAWIIHLISKILGGKSESYAARLALFWAFLAASPLMLLNGLVAGMIGPSPGLTLVGAIWTLFFLWFLGAGLFQAYWAKEPVSA